MTLSMLGKVVTMVAVTAGAGYGLSTVIEGDPQPTQTVARVDQDRQSGHASTAPKEIAATLVDSAAANTPTASTGAEPDPVVAAATGESAQSAPDSPPAPAAASEPNAASDQRSIAANLLAATEDADRSLQLGPIKACFDQMRAFACPIVGSVPVVKDIVGRISMELGISCPTVSSPTPI